MKKCLVVRLGAYGDNIIITPALKKLKEMGYYNVVNTNKRGEEVFRLNPNVDEIIQHDESMKVDDLPAEWDRLKEVVKPERFINFSESIECNVALHPIQPTYIYPKWERRAVCDKNYYDVTEEWAKLDGCQKLPELFFTEDERAQARSYLKPDKYNILWQLSGSGRQKVYPWTDYVIGEVLKNYDDCHFITVGDEACQLLESITDENITNVSGKIPIRTAFAMTAMVDLVISPDTGVLHAAGCFETPKIGLLGHTTVTNITKYFKNDYSIEAECPCAPCFRLIYDHDIQCPIDALSLAAWCMSQGIPPEKLYGRIREVRASVAVGV